MFQEGVNYLRGVGLIVPVPLRLNSLRECRSNQSFLLILALAHPGGYCYDRAPIDVLTLSCREW